MGGKLIRLVYCGILGYSYDITCIIDAIKELDKNYQKKIQFIVMGDGQKNENFKNNPQVFQLFILEEYHILKWYGFLVDVILLLILFLKELLKV